MYICQFPIGKARLQLQARFFLRVLSVMFQSSIIFCFRQREQTRSRLFILIIFCVILLSAEKTTEDNHITQLSPLPPVWLWQVLLLVVRQRRHLQHY